MNQLMVSVIFVVVPICCCCSFFSANVNELVTLKEQVIVERQVDVIRVLPTFTPTTTPTTTDTPAADNDRTSVTITPTLTLLPTQDMTSVTMTPSPTAATETPPVVSPTSTIGVPPISTSTITPMTPTSTPTPLPTDDDDDSDDSDRDTPTPAPSPPTTTSTATAMPTFTSTPTVTPSPTNTPVPPVVNFGAATFDVEEWSGPVTMTVLLDKSWPMTMTVDYGLTPQTATAGEDYEPTQGTLTFEPGQTSHTFTIKLVDDLLIEKEAEIVTLTLSDPSPPLQLGLLTTVPLNISSDDTNTVNTAVDSDDGACTVTHCTLREAINTLNADPNQNAILFDLPGPGPHTITPLTPLPVITAPITIDGTTQAGASCVSWPPTLLIELDGSAAASATDGLYITAGNSLVRGLVINGFGSGGGSGVGLHLETGGGNQIECNFIGTDISGQLAQGNATGLLLRDSAENRIGGQAPNKRNLISGNEADGLVVEGSGAVNNKIEGNYIGAAADGSTALSNGQGGLNQRNGATGSTIGGDVVEARNLIAYNQGGGIIGESGVLTMSHTIVAQNSAANGAGVFNRGLLIVHNSIISGNLAKNSGGGIYNEGHLSLTNTTLNNNAAQSGGAIYNIISGTAILTNSTLSRNVANGDGGGLWSAGLVTATNITLNLNSAINNGGGIQTVSGSVSLKNSLIAAGVIGANCSSSGGILTSADFNLDSDGSCQSLFGGGAGPNDQVAAVVNLGPLAENGGSTRTHALLPGSPAIDTGSCPGITVDQRGEMRPVDQPNPVLNVDDGCDVGAFEMQ